MTSYPYAVLNLEEDSPDARCPQKATGTLEATTPEEAAKRAYERVISEEWYADVEAPAAEIRIGAEMFRVMARKRLIVRTT